MTSGGGNPGGFSAAGYELAHTWARSAIAEALGNLGQVDIALALLAEARELMERNDERYVESEIHRIHGELKLKQAAHASSTSAIATKAEAEAEQSFLKAIEIARERGAKTLELRAATGLSRMLVNSGRNAEARAVCCNRFMIGSPKDLIGRNSYPPNPFWPISIQPQRPILIPSVLLLRSVAEANSRRGATLTHQSACHRRIGAYR